MPLPPYYLKVTERQINTSNRLLHRKEGNKTWSVPTRALVNSALLAVSASSPKAGSTFPLAISTASQVASTSNIVSPSQACNQLNNVRSSQSSNISSSQAGSQVTSSPNSVNNNPHADNANSWAVSTVTPKQLALPRLGTPRQLMLTPRQQVPVILSALP